MTAPYVVIGQPDRTPLGQAVHRHRAITPRGVLERLFTLAFQGLVYPQIWEDPVVDLDALEVTDRSDIVTIASGGCNVLNYLVAGPRSITAVDLNHAHVALTRLKLCALARVLDRMISENGGSLRFERLYRDYAWYGRLSAPSH
jgi:S-adenosylmethionine:diacylglycerol 3-amino-3-carboxypropyl transferase